MNEETSRSLDYTRTHRYHYALERLQDALNMIAGDAKFHKTISTLQGAIYHLENDENFGKDHK